MKVRNAGRVALASMLLTLAGAGFGCGGGIEEGMPKDIDMTKDYRPPVPVGPIQAGKPMQTTPPAPITPATP